MPPPAEPSLATLRQPWQRYLAATRPAFLSVTLVGCLLGFATAAADGHAIAGWLAALVTLFALVAHAGANVLNDYHDALSGCDAANSARLFPFTGGSRMIQNGVFSTATTYRYARLLLLAVVPAGLLLTVLSGPGLIVIGLCGLVAGWAYSAPPLKLQSRGWGEPTIALAWLTVVVGADFVARHDFAVRPFAAGIGYALLVANVLLINQFPDRAADAASGKGTLVVRLGPGRARWAYLALALLAHAGVAIFVAAGVLPALALAALLTLAPALRAAGQLLRHAEAPALLTPAIKLTIACAIAHGLLLATAQLIAGS